MLVASQKIYLADSKIINAGRGIFASNNIEKDELIEICPVLIIPKNEVNKFVECVLDDYIFYWGKKHEWGVSLNARAIALGFGSLYNHSYRLNATYIRNLEKQTIEFIAIKKIVKDEEITVNYNFGDPEITAPVSQNNIPPFSNR